MTDDMTILLVNVGPGKYLRKDKIGKGLEILLIGEGIVQYTG